MRIICARPHLGVPRQAASRLPRHEDGGSDWGRPVLQPPPPGRTAAEGGSPWTHPPPPDLSEARQGARWLAAVAPWLPLTVVVVGGLGIWAAPSHRVALMAGGIGTGVMMCGLLVGLAVSVRSVWMR